jgi:cytochrome c oxidase cbb3-type subunit 3
MCSRFLSVLPIASAVLALISCQRERRDLRPEPARLAIFADAARQSELLPGGPETEKTVSNPYDGSAFAISEGKRLYNWYNCSGCHFAGGGGIGPPLIKEEWIYGGEPANLFDTIVKGRPNGMPAWGGRVPEYQVWQLVAYVRSLNGKQPQSATPVRSDSLETDTTTIRSSSPGEER